MDRVKIRHCKIRYFYPILYSFFTVEVDYSIIQMKINQFK